MDAKLFTTAADLVVLPGLMCDSRMFGATVAAVDGARVIDGFYGNASSLPAMAEYVLDRLPARASILGHSMGARIALELWRLAPERVERLALVDTGVHGVRPGEAEARHALRDLGRTHGIAALVDAWLPPMLGTAAQADQELRDALGAMCIHAGLSTYERQVAALLSRPEVDNLLPQVACPAFAIVGAEDRWSPPAQHEEIAAAIPGAQLRVVAGAGHMLPAEKPNEFNKIVQEWLDIPAAR